MILRIFQLGISSINVAVKRILNFFVNGGGGRSIFLHCPSGMQELSFNF